MGTKYRESLKMVRLIRCEIIFIKIPTFCKIPSTFAEKCLKT